MLFNEKLQELRKNKNLTQEELAKALFVSRTAVSKWESGRGYPNIDSLKAIANFFGVSVDELLSSNEVLALAEEDGRENSRRFKTALFGLVDVFASILLFLPVFANRGESVVTSTSIAMLTQVQPYVKILFFSFILLISTYGIVELTLQNYESLVWEKYKHVISFVLNVCALLLFIISLQPYVAIYFFLMLAIKVVATIKRQRH